MSPTGKHTSPSLQRALLEFILGRPAVTLDLAGPEAVFWRMSAILPRRGQSKPQKLSTQPHGPFQDVSFACSSSLLAFPHIKITPFPFSSFLETNQNPTTKHPLCPSKLYPTLSALQTRSTWKRFEPLRDRPGRPQTVFTSLGSYLCLWLLLYPSVCCCSFCGLFCVTVVHFPFLSL